MQPTIGKIVHYKNTETEKAFQQDAEFAPAIITRVLGDICVNLAIFQDAGEVIHRKTRVLLGTEPGTWAWPERV